MSSDLVQPVVVALVLLAGLAFLLWRARPYPEARRRAEGERWARKHQAYVSAEWVATVDRSLERRRRVGLAGFAVVLVSASTLPTANAVLVGFASVPALVAIVRGHQVTSGDLLPAGPRVARLRELSLDDYLQPSLRILMWAMVGLGCAVALVAAYLTSPWLVLSALVLLSGGVAVEVTGARLARMPEPAGDPAHLYWQDALRVDALHSAVSFTTTAASLSCLAIVNLAGTSTITRWDFLLVALLLVAAVLGLWAEDHPVSRMRSRLWPSLAPGQVLAPGTPVPSREAPC
jgi:hypothetical protein